MSKRLLANLVDPQLKQHVNSGRANSARAPWFAGDAFTAADVQMSFPLEGAASYAGLRDGRPKAAAFLDVIHARPAYQRALECGGPYALAATK